MEIKKDYNLEGRDLFSAPEAQTFEYGDYSYKIMPMTMMQRRKWSKIVKDKERFTLKYMADNEYGNLYKELQNLFEVDYKNELDPVKRFEQWCKSFDTQSEDIKKRYFEMDAQLAECREYAFGEIDLNQIFDMIEQVVTVDRDDYSGMCRSYLQYHCTYEEIVFICDKIEEVSTLSPLEVLGLK